VTGLPANSRYFLAEVLGLGSAVAFRHEVNLEQEPTEKWETEKYERGPEGLHFSVSHFSVWSEGSYIPRHLAFFSLRMIKAALER